MGLDARRRWRRVKQGAEAAGVRVGYMYPNDNAGEQRGAQSWSCFNGNDTKGASILNLRTLAFLLYPPVVHISPGILTSSSEQMWACCGLCEGSPLGHRSPWGQNIPKEGGVSGYRAVISSAPSNTSSHCAAGAILPDRTSPPSIGAPSSAGHWEADVRCSLR